MDLEKEAKEAFFDDHFELAVDLYTRAIGVNPKNAELFADRAQANIKLNNFTGIFFSFSVFRCSYDLIFRMYLILDSFYLFFFLFFGVFSPPF